MCLPERRNLMFRTFKFGRFAMILLVSASLVFVSSMAFAAEGKYGGTLRIGVKIPQFGRLDARYGTLEGMSPVTGMIYDCLFNWGPDGYKSMVPQLATSYETKDNKVWTIKLRKGVKFHNGREMTAEDVKTNLDWRIKTPKGWRPVKYKEYIKYLKEVQVVDKYTIKMILDQPFSPLIRIMSYAFRGILPPEEVDRWGKKFMEHPVGTGPFKVVSIKPKEKIVVERFDDYWGPRPYIDRIEYIFIRDDDARLIALQKGEIDIANYMTFAQEPLIRKDPNIDIHITNSPLIVQKYYFNFLKWPSSDIRFRKALWVGVDWKTSAINAYPYKKGLYAGTHLNRSDFYNPDAWKLVPAYNPEEAKRLIKAVEKDAGKKIPPIYWLSQGNATGRTMGELVKLQLAQLGVTLNLQLLPPANWYEKGYGTPVREWDLFGYGLAYGLDPALGYMTFATDSGAHRDGKSLGGYSNPEFDQYLIKAENAPDNATRVKYYHEAEKVLLQDVACIPTLNMRTLNAYSKRVKGFKQSNTGLAYVTNTFSNFWLEK
jgi:peptide/nickel transport system substrate-binding protein